MGDFDVNPNPNSSGEKKKLVLVSVLGLVLAGVLGYHFFGNSPQNAVAAVPNSGDSIPQDMTLALSPDDALKGLENDPTSKLLRNSDRNDPSLDKVPNNPFRMSDRLRQGLTNSSGKPIFTDPGPHTVGPTPVTLRSDNYILSTIVRQNDRFIAILNGNFVQAGSVFDETRVVDVLEDRVILQHVDYPNGPKTIVKIRQAARPQ